MIDKLSRLQPISLNALRIMVGLMYWSHGAQKLFAWFGRETPAELMSRTGAAGVIEFFGGVAIIFGIFTQPVAFLISGEMAFAYFLGHASRPDSPWYAWWANGGELAATYSFIFLVVAAYGGGDFSIDGILKKRRAATA